MVRRFKKCSGVNPTISFKAADRNWKKVSCSRETDAQSYSESATVFIVNLSFHYILNKNGVGPIQLDKMASNRRKQLF